MSDAVEYLSPEQVVERKLLPFGNADWVRQQLRTGKLGGSLVGGRWVTTEADVKAMVEAASNSQTKTRRRRNRAVA